jgi:hypothetical protein
MARNDIVQERLLVQTLTRYSVECFWIFQLISLAAVGEEVGIGYMARALVECTWYCMHCDLYFVEGDRDRNHFVGARLWDFL